MTDKPPLIESLRRYGSDFISHAASRGIEDIEAAGELMLAAARVLAEQPAEQEPVALLHDDGYWTAAKTDAGRRLSERLLFAGSPSIAVYTAPQPAKSAEQEPVAWMQESTEVIRSDWGFDKRGYIPLYAAPQPRKRLTREDIQDAVCDVDLDWHQGWPLDEDAPNRYETLCRAIEAAVWGEKT